MNAARKREDRLRSELKGLQIDNPKFSQTVLELAEVLDALGREEEADPFYKLGTASRSDKEALWAAARQQEYLRPSQNSAAGRQRESIPIEQSAQHTGGEKHQLRGPSSTRSKTEAGANQHTSILRGADSGKSNGLHKGIQQDNPTTPSGRATHSSRRPDQQIFRPRVQIEAEERKAVERRKLEAEQQRLAALAQEARAREVQASVPAPKRQEWQIFRPRVQIEADERRAAERRDMELEEQRLAKEKEARQARGHESVAFAQERKAAALKALLDHQTKPASKIESWQRRSSSTVEIDKDLSSLDIGGHRDTEDVRTIPYEGRHVLEIMGIKVTDSEKDIDTFLASIYDFPIKPQIRWADSSHALAVFSDLQTAQQALQQAPEEGRLWLRPYARASHSCKQIAASELYPPVVRPPTTDIVARRLLGHALNNTGLRDLEGERDLRAQRKEKKAEKERKQKALDAAWGDEVE